MPIIPAAKIREEDRKAALLFLAYASLGGNRSLETLFDVLKDAEKLTKP